MFVGVKAFAPSLYTPEDAGKNAGLPGHCDHYDLYAPQGNTLYGCLKVRLFTRQPFMMGDCRHPAGQAA